MRADKDVIPDYGVCGDECHALDTDIGADGAVPLNDGAGADRCLISDRRLLADQDVMAGVAAVSEGDIRIEDGAGPESDVISEYCSGMVGSADVLAGGEADGDRVKDGEGFADSIDAVFDHLKEK